MLNFHKCDYSFGNSIYSNSQVRFPCYTSKMSEQHLDFQQAALALAAYTSPNHTYIPPVHRRILSWLTDVDANRPFSDHSLPPIVSQFEYPDSLYELFSDNPDVEPDSNSSSDETENPLADLNNDPSSDPNHLPHVFWDEPELMSRFGDDVEVEYHILLLQFLQKSRLFTEADKQEMSKEASIQLEKRLWKLQARCIINFQ